jgi:hydroxymethylpyrimidine/phosphomethylpyrimidine kinase
MRGRVLIIAGSDSGGGAGVQADIKSVSALGGFAATAITALTAQNSLGVHSIYPVAPEFIEDIGADCLKTGMLHSAEVIEVVSDVIKGKASQIPLVADPVMVAKGGANLLDESARSAMIKKILPLATLLTPNAPEASVLSGIDVVDVNSQQAAGETLLKMGARAVLVKGGHISGANIIDLLLTNNGTFRFESNRILTQHTHGTGCTLASGIAAGLAQGMDLQRAVSRARTYLSAAITAAPGFGSGHGPIDHTVTVDLKKINS